MDIVLEKKQRKLLPTRRWLASLLALPVILAGGYVWSLNQAGGSVDGAGLVIGEVRRGDFKVSVRGTGVLVPDNIQWLTAESDATVTKLAAKAGTVVKAGDVIVELSNPQLVQALAQAKWDLQVEEAEAQASKVAQRLELLTQEASVANIKMNYESKLLRQRALEKLLATKAVSRIEYEETELETAQFKERWRISREQLEEMRQNVAAQDNSRAAKVNKARKAYERIAEQVEGLEVEATMDSIVLESPLRVGQRLAIGDNIAKLAQQNSLIAELRVPEIQIRDVAVGQPVTIDTRNNKVRGTVSRIDPAVVNGHVQVDVAFSEPLPGDARPDLSVDGEIIVAEIRDTLHVNRPLFAQSKSRVSLYKLTDGGRSAERVDVTLGLGSVSRIQVVAGLAAGDRIITSDPTRFEMHARFRID